MTGLVVDASVVVKWVIAEPDHERARRFRAGNTFRAPDLLVVECANILWKKSRRGELSAAEAELACMLLTGSGVQLHPMQDLMPEALRLALALDHPAYDCAYLALAASTGLPFITADQRLVAKVRQGTAGRVLPEIIALGEDTP